MNSLHRVIAALEGLRYRDLENVSAATGVPHGTLVRLKYGQVKNPRFETVQKLERHFAEEVAA